MRMVHKVLTSVSLFILFYCCFVYGAPKCSGLNKKYNSKCNKFTLPKQTKDCLTYQQKVENKKGGMTNQYVCKIEHDPVSKAIKQTKVKDIISKLKAFDEASGHKKKKKGDKISKPSASHTKKSGNVNKIISVTVSKKKETEIEYEFKPQSTKILPTQPKKKQSKPTKRRLPAIENVNGQHQPPSNVLKAVGALMIYDADDNEWKLVGSGALIKPQDSDTSKYVLTVAHNIYLCHAGCTWLIEKYMRFFPGYTSQNAPQGNPIQDNPPQNSYAIKSVYFPLNWRYSEPEDELVWWTHNQDNLNEDDWGIIELDDAPNVTPIEVEARWTFGNTKYPAEDKYYTVGYPGQHKYKMMTTYNYNNGNPTGNDMVGYLIGDWKQGLGYKTDQEGVLDHGCSGGPTLNLNDNKIYGIHRKSHVEVIDKDGNVLSDDDSSSSVVITKDLWHLIQYIINGFDDIQFIYMYNEPQKYVEMHKEAKYTAYGSDYVDHDENDEFDLYHFSHDYDGYHFNPVFMDETVMMIDIFLSIIICMIGCCLCGMVAGFMWMKYVKK